ncbi:MAG: hypothetical protein HY340_00050 [Candidatus Kerfeldbacteria bacterium]|nr:hypothetical protein [Candidatus Kerfeldbacteria bacterium]
MGRSRARPALLRQLRHDRELWAFLNRELPPFVGEVDFLGIVSRTGKTFEELADFFDWETADDVRNFFLPTPGTTENGLKAALNFDRLHYLIMVADEAAIAW